MPEKTKGRKGRGRRKDEGDGRAPRVRPLWSGTVSFGLVSIPVELYPAYRSGSTGLRMLDEDGTPLTQRYVCPDHGREVERDEIVRGYETGDGELVVVEDDELEALAPRRSRDIELRRFVHRADLDPVYFERAYFVAPAGETTKAYRLLAATMEERGRAGIATFVMRTKEYLVAILSENGILRAETLRFHDEIRTPADVGLEAGGSPPADRVKELTAAVDALVADEIDREELEDEEAERLLRLVQRKRKRDEDVVRPTGGRAEVESGQVIDLMEALKRSLRATERDDRTKGGAGGASGGAGREDLASLTKEELYRRAQERDVPGRSGMTKAELVEALERSA